LITVEAIEFNAWRAGRNEAHCPSWAELLQLSRLTNAADEQPIAVPVLLR